MKCCRSFGMGKYPEAGETLPRDVVILLSLQLGFFKSSKRPSIIGGPLLLQIWKFSSRSFLSRSAKEFGKLTTEMIGQVSCHHVSEMWLKPHGPFCKALHLNHLPTSPTQEILVSILHYRYTQLFALASFQNSSDSRINMVVPVEPVSLTIGVVALASLFSTCIECFDYFKAGQALEEDFELLLVKLDVEKTRLLIWGNAVGVLKPEGEGRVAELDNSQKAELIERCLGSIKSLLSDTDKFRNLYGLRSSTGSDKNARSHSILSVNSMSVFKTSYRRFCARFAGSQSRSSLVMRTRWAIHDKNKFEGLLHHLKDLIDGLNEVVLVKRETQDQIMHDDIVSILDISKLRLIQSACEGTYTALSRVASTVIEASEYGTIDRRNIEEWLGDAKNMSEDDQDAAGGGRRNESLSNPAQLSSQGRFPALLSSAFLTPVQCHSLTKSQTSTTLAACTSS